MADQEQVQMILTMYQDVQFWRTDANRGVATARTILAEQLHREALLEAMARRGGPRGAREWFDRAWLQEQLHPEVCQANEVAYAAHRFLHPPKRKRGRSLASFYAASVAAQDACV